MVATVDTFCCAPASTLRSCVVACRQKLIAYCNQISKSSVYFNVNPSAVIQDNINSRGVFNISERVDLHYTQFCELTNTRGLAFDFKKEHVFFFSFNRSSIDLF